jgi:hypothetical protein
MNLEAVRTVVEVVALVLALPALYLARKHAQGLEKTTGTLVGITGTLTGITESLSTKYVDRYPVYVEEITKLLNKANHSIVIVCDVPAYCVFSDPRRWRAYEAALTDALARTAEKTVKWLERQLRSELLKEQFHDDPSQPNAWKATGPGADEKKMTEFLQRHNNALQTTYTFANITFADFERLAEADHAAAANAVSQYTKVVLLRGRLGLMFWIVDGKEAIFAVPNFNDREQGQGFRTTDQRLINAFLAISSRL